VVQVDGTCLFEPFHLNKFSICQPASVVQFGQCWDRYVLVRASITWKTDWKDLR